MYLFVYLVMALLSADLCAMDAHLQVHADQQRAIVPHEQLPYVMNVLLEEYLLSKQEEFQRLDKAFSPLSQSMLNVLNSKLYTLVYKQCNYYSTLLAAWHGNDPIAINQGLLRLSQVHLYEAQNRTNCGRPSVIHRVPIDCGIHADQRTSTSFLFERMSTSSARYSPERACAAKQAAIGLSLRSLCL